MNHTIIINSHLVEEFTVKINEILLSLRIKKKKDNQRPRESNLFALL